MLVTDSRYFDSETRSQHHASKVDARSGGGSRIGVTKSSLVTIVVTLLIIEATNILISIYFFVVNITRISSANRNPVNFAWVGLTSLHFVLSVVNLVIVLSSTLCWAKRCYPGPLWLSAGSLHVVRFSMMTQLILSFGVELLIDEQAAQLSDVFGDCLTLLICLVAVLVFNWLDGELFQRPLKMREHELLDARMSLSRTQSGFS